MKDIASNVSKAVGATSSDDTHLSVAESSLRLDLCDDLELAEVDLEPLVDAASDLLLRTPRAAAALRANPASQHGHTHTHTRTHTRRRRAAKLSQLFHASSMKNYTTDHPQNIGT